MNAIGAKETQNTATVSRNNPYNYPASYQTMSMSVISHEDGFKTTKAKFHSPRRTSSNLFNADIEGSSPKKYGSIEVNKQDFTCYNGDIDRSSPQMLHFQLNKPENYMRTDDILFCKPQIFKFQTRRSSNPQNPLVPNYNLPVSNPAPMTPRKFIKDTLNTTDIEKSSPRFSISNKESTNFSLNNQDIEGSKASPKIKQRRSSAYSSYNYDDVVKPEPLKNKRQSIDPLNPVYTAIGEDGKGYQIGPVEGSKSVVFRELLTGNKDYNSCKDVVGAQASTKGLGIFEQRRRREFKISLNNADIFGAQVGTSMRGMKTTRNGNPLDTNYMYPGQSELVAKDPYSKTKKEKEMEARKQQTSIISKAGQQIFDKNHAQELMRQVQDGPKTISQKFDSFVKK